MLRKVGVWNLLLNNQASLINCRNGCKEIGSKVNQRSFGIKASPELTSIRYNVKRGAYSELNDKHLAFFERLLSQNRVITDPGECDSYNIDWFKIVKGSYQ